VIFQKVLGKGNGVSGGDKGVTAEHFWNGRARDSSPVTQQGKRDRNEEQARLSRNCGEQRVEKAGLGQSHPGSVQEKSTYAIGHQPRGSWSPALTMLHN
jgi:hypothetical protein